MGDLKKLPALQNIIDAEKSGQDLSEMVPANTLENMKSFLILYTNSQIDRTVKLHEAMIRLEDKIIRKMDDSDLEDLDFKTLLNLAGMLQKSIDSVLGLMKQVTTDEQYKVIFTNATIINNNLTNIQTNNITEVIPELKSKDTREKVRMAASIFINKLKETTINEGDKKLDNQIIDVVPEETK